MSKDIKRPGSDVDMEGLDVAGKPEIRRGVEVNMKDVVEAIEVGRRGGSSAVEGSQLVDTESGHINHGHSENVDLRIALGIILKQGTNVRNIAEFITQRLRIRVGESAAMDFENAVVFFDRPDTDIMEFCKFAYEFVAVRVTERDEEVPGSIRVDRARLQRPLSSLLGPDPETMEVDESLVDEVRRHAAEMVREIDVEAVEEELDERMLGLGGDLAVDLHRAFFLNEKFADVLERFSKEERLTEKEKQIVVISAAQYFGEVDTVLRDCTLKLLKA